MEHLPKRTIHWKCPHCTNRITLHVRVTHSPICHNPAAHSSRAVEMVRMNNQD